MSCIRFIGGPASTTPRSGPPLRFLSPPKTIHKVVRLTSMALSDRVSDRAAAAGNPMVPKEVLQLLANDSEFVVRSWVARNPKVPLEVLQYLSENDPDISLQMFAKYRIRMVEL